MHRKFEEELYQQRKMYCGTEQTVKKSLEPKQSMKSNMMIDYIQELRVAKVGGKLIHSLNQKVVNSSFVRFKHRYSITEERESGQYTLVETIYNK